MDDLFLNVIEQEARAGSPSAACKLGDAYRAGEGVEKNERTAADWYMRATLAGDVNARAWLGTMMNEGRGKPENTQALCADLKARADSGAGAACCLLGMVLREGWGCEKDYDTANAYFTKGALELGHVGCLNNLGYMHNHGWGFVKDEAVAVEWYRKAAEQGDASAQSNLGTMYWDGRGVPKDGAIAVEWLTKSAEQGYAPAQYKLGLMIYKGVGVEKNPERGADWLRKAAEQGYTPAQRELAIHYQVGNGVPCDSALAVAWYLKASKQGDLQAHFSLGLHYYGGVKPSKKNDPYLDQVAAWRRAAEKGDTEAQFNLGNHFMRLRGKENMDTGEAWYLKAAEGGNVRALNKMADRFSERWRPDADYPRAVALYRKAAEQDDYHACLCLGDLYREGKGVENDEAQGALWIQRGFECFHQQTKLVDVQSVDVSVVDRMQELSMRVGDNISYCARVDSPCDEALAFQHFRTAAEQGHVQSMFMLGICYQNGRGTEQDQAEAFKWLSKAAENRSIDAQLNVGLMYQRGLGVARNEVLALKWLHQAADNGHAGAQCQMGGAYRLGQGVDKDIDRALQWYMKAEAQKYMRVVTPRMYVKEEAFMQWHRTAMDLFRRKRYGEALDALEKSIRHPLNKSEDPYLPSAESIDDLHVGVNPEWNRCAAEVSSLRREGKLEEARLAARQALKLAEDLGESGLSDVATSLNILGEVYFEMKDLKMAQALFQRALALRVRTLGSSHPEVAECLHNIDASLKPMPLDEETRRQCRAISTLALRIRVKAYGRNHPLVALSLMALAKTHLELGDHDKSFSCARNAADIFEKTLGSSHLHTQVARAYISVIQDDLDELEEMIRLEEEDPLDPNDVAGQIYRWSSRSPRLAKGKDGE